MQNIMANVISKNDKFLRAHFVGLSNSVSFDAKMDL